jgi:hypothetical protein
LCSTVADGSTAPLSPRSFTARRSSTTAAGTSWTGTSAIP